MKTRSFLDNLPLEIIIKIATYLEDDDRLSLLRSSESAIKKFPSIQNDYRDKNCLLRDNLGLHIENYQRRNKLSNYCWGILIGLAIIIDSIRSLNMPGILFGSGVTLFSFAMNNKIKNACEEECKNLKEMHLATLKINR